MTGPRVLPDGGRRSRLDRSVFVRPVAHRGLHGAPTGMLENTAGAFTAAIRQGLAIECDVQPAADATPVVFHDESLARLVEAPGRTRDHGGARLAAMGYRSHPHERILRLGDMLDLVAGQVPILVEIKSEWAPPEREFLAAVADVLGPYRGPYAVMSFDPAIVALMRELLPEAPRGIVSGLYDAQWWPGKLDADRAFRLSHLLESGPAEPDFFAYHVKALPTPVTRFVREALGIPLFTWTVRTAADLAVAARWADAPIFEDIDPASRA